MKSTFTHSENMNYRTDFQSVIEANNEIVIPLDLLVTAHHDDQPDIDFNVHIRVSRNEYLSIIEYYSETHDSEIFESDSDTYDFSNMYAFTDDVIDQIKAEYHRVIEDSVPNDYDYDEEFDDLHLEIRLSDNETELALEMPNYDREELECSDILFSLDVSDGSIITLKPQLQKKLREHIQTYYDITEPELKDYLASKGEFCPHIDLDSADAIFYAEILGFSEKTLSFRDKGIRNYESTFGWETKELLEQFGYTLIKDVYRDKNGNEIGEVISCECC